MSEERVHGWVADCVRELNALASAPGCEELQTCSPCKAGGKARELLPAPTWCSRRIIDRLPECAAVSSGRCRPAVAGQASPPRAACPVETLPAGKQNQVNSWRHVRQQTDCSAAAGWPAGQAGAPPGAPPPHALWPAGPRRRRAAGQGGRRAVVARCGGTVHGDTHPLARTARQRLSERRVPTNPKAWPSPKPMSARLREEQDSCLPAPHHRPVQRGGPQLVGKVDGGACRVSERRRSASRQQRPVEHNLLGASSCRRQSSMPDTMSTRRPGQAVKTSACHAACPPAALPATQVWQPRDAARLARAHNPHSRAPAASRASSEPRAPRWAAAMRALIPSSPHLQGCTGRGGPPWESARGAHQGLSHTTDDNGGM